MLKMTSFQRKVALMLLLANGAICATHTEFSAETSEELMEKKQQVDLRIEALNEEIVTLQKELEAEIIAYNRTKFTINRLSYEIEQLQEKIQQRKEVIEARLKAYQVHGSNLNIYVEAIFGSGKIVDIMSRVSSVNSILEADHTLYKELKETQQKLAEKRIELDQLNEQQEERYRDMQIQASDLELLIAEERFLSLELEEAIAEAQERERIAGERLEAQLELESLRMLQGPLDATGVDNPPAQLEQIAEGVALAKTYMGMPYTWGGMHPSTSFDCSGLIYWSYRQKGIDVPRTSRQQYAATIRLKQEDVLPGDLVFFAYDGRIGHVGIYMGDGLMLNSQNAGVKIESIIGWQKYFAGYGRVVH